MAAYVAGTLLVRGADVGVGHPVDVALSGGRISAVRADGVPGWRGEVLDAGGGALLPGLHDHHLHLRALAAARRSAPAGPPGIVDRAGLEASLRQARRALEARGQAPGTGRWVRAIGYHESVAGDLERRTLDAIVPDVPVRVQHRSGAVWIVNSAGADALGLDTLDHPGVERDAAGRPTGRLFRLDQWLGARTATADRGDGVDPDGPEVRALSRAAARAGVTGFTEASPGLGPDQLDWLTAQVVSGRIQQRLTVMWSLDPTLDRGGQTAARAAAGIGAGPVKFLLDDVGLPTPDDLAADLSRAHRAGRPVAIHCVSRAQSVVAAAALEACGSRPGDRLEHGSVIPTDLIPTLRRTGVTVVTNPAFVRDRGDRYLVDVEVADRPDLYRAASLVAAGVALAAGTDAPFGNPDPWVSIRAAVDRTTHEGAVLGRDEAVSVRAALDLFTGRPDAPATPRRVAEGEPADLCLLAVPFSALDGAGPDQLSAAVVRATLVGGRVVHEAS